MTHSPLIRDQAEAGGALECLVLEVDKLRERGELMEAAHYFDREPALRDALAHGLPVLLAETDRLYSLVAGDPATITDSAWLQFWNGAGEVASALKLIGETLDRREAERAQFGSVN